MSPETVIRSDAPALESSIQARAKARPDASLYIAGVAYALLVALTIHFHEPWADEAQSWLLGRDASLADLWGRLLHYEGTPGLWQTLLHALIRLGLPYSAYNFVSGILGLTAVYLLLRYAPLPLFIRILLPFTYYLCYQYAVLARSYALVAPLLFAIAATYTQAQRKPALTTVLAVPVGGRERARLPDIGLHRGDSLCAPGATVGADPSCGAIEARSLRVCLLVHPRLLHGLRVASERRRFRRASGPREPGVSFRM